MSKKVMINCNEASSICNKNQYCKTSFLDKLKLGIHNFLCKRCKLYSEQNELMTKIFKIHLHKSKDVKLCTEDKDVLRNNLRKKINS